MINNQTLFIKGLDEFSSKYLKHLNPINEAKFIVEHMYLISKISELLLLNDKISIKVYGENVPLTLLIRWFGVDGVLELLKQDALEFVLWTPLITYNVDEIKGIFPLQSGTLNSDVHCKPRISAQEGFRWLKADEKPSKSVQKKIIRQVKKVTIVPPENLSNNIVDIVKFSYPEYQKLYELKKGDLPLDQRKKLASIATETLELSIAAKYKYSFWNEENKRKLLENRFADYSKANIIYKNASKVLQIEKLPDISKLVASGIIPTKDIPQLRISNDTVKFRKWLNSISTKTDDMSIAQEYVKSLRPKYGFTGSRWFKPVRIGSFSIVGGIAGALMGDPSMGLLANTISGTAAGILLSSIDQYVLEGLITGWKPQNFIDRKIRPYM